MSGAGDSGRRRARIGAGAESAFLDGLRGGARVEDAAAAAGFTACAFYKRAKKTPEFQALWAAARAQGDAGARPGARGPRPGASDDGGAAVRIEANNRRVLQRRSMPHVSFDAARQDAFLADFCWSCDARKAARAAGVSESTVYVRRRKDPAFAAAYAEALEQGYARLEAEALRERLAAQARLRAAIEAADEREPGKPGGGGDAGAEFDRAMALLARHDRRARRPESGGDGAGRKSEWTFETAAGLLERRLKALAVPVAPLAQAAAERFDGPSGEPKGGDAGGSEAGEEPDGEALAGGGGSGGAE